MVKTSRVDVFNAMERTKQSVEQSGGDLKAYFQSSPVEVEMYLHRRYIYARALLRPNTCAGIVQGLENCLEIAKLDTENQQNGQTAQEFVPGLYLRLGRDKECYDFIKKSCYGDLEEIYRCDNGKPRRPVVVGDFSLGHAAMLCLLNLRILQDLRNLDKADTDLGDKLPAELFHEARSYLISPATKADAARMKAIEKREDLKPHMQKVENDLQDLRGYINAIEKDYFHAIADPEKFRKKQVMYQPELPIVEVLHQTYEVWAESPGALALWQEVCISWDAEDVD